jgi:Holin of 3TMs, for gene-transfer release
MAFDPFTAGFDLAKTVLNKFFPDANEEMRNKFSQASMEIQNEYALQLNQLSINAEEAKSTSVFVAGWRPMVGWVGALGLGYQVLFMPIINGILLFFGIPNVFVGIDITLLQTTLGTMLGIGISRSWEKTKGVDTKQLGK